MQEIPLAAERGRATGSATARRLRRAGKVPAVLYGHGVDPQPLAVDGRALRGALTGEAGVNTLIALDVDGASHLAMARQLQRHPVRGSVEHVDFVIVRRDEVVAADVPVHLVGDAEEVHRGDGMVDQQLFTITVHATPADIPPAIEADISGLTIGDAIRVGDLVLPAGVTTDVDAEEPVVVAVASHVAAEMEAVEAGAAEEPLEAAEQRSEGGGGESPGAEANTSGG